MAAAIGFGLIGSGSVLRPERRPAPRLAIEPRQLPANGYAVATLTIRGAGSAAPRIAVANAHAASVEDVSAEAGMWRARIRAGVLPGRTRIRVEIAGAPPAFAELETVADIGDSFADGTPDFLRLDDARDRRAFRRWFTYLAESQYFQAPEARPVEIDDCAALLRYAYREALRGHEGGWAAAARLPEVPAFESAGKFQYPYTPLGAALFRVRDGAFREADAGGGAFAQFADVKTLWRLNTHFVSRRLDRARPGDLLFFRQAGDRRTFHSMIYAGESQLRPDGARYLIYHTGPDQGTAGEMRRLTVAELARFPQPEWRPLPANPNFLGVFRWNILREDIDEDAGTRD